MNKDKRQEWSDPAKLSFLSGLACIVFLPYPANPLSMAQQEEGQRPIANFGTAVAVGSDVDGDQVPDILVGAPSVTGERPAKQDSSVWLLSGASGRIIHDYWVPKVDGPNFGSSLAWIEDMDGDGVAEVVVGSPMYDSDGGRVLVYSGKTAKLLKVLRPPAAIASFGASLCSRGDIDGDQIADLVVGSPSQGEQAGAGSINVFSGADLSLVYQLSMESAGGRVGASLDSSRDFNSDGYSDLLIGAPGEIGADSRGEVWLFSGKDGKTVLQHLQYASGEYLFGTSVAAIGTLQRTRIVVGCSSTKDGGASGQVRVFDGDSGRLLFSTEGDAGDSGVLVAGGGDLDSDGYEDFMMSAPRGFYAGGLLGTVSMVSGRTGDKIRSVGWMDREDEWPPWGFGYCLDGTADFDNDGTFDQVIGAPRAGGGVCVVSGRTGDVILSVTRDDIFEQQ